MELTAVGLGTDYSIVDERWLFALRKATFHRVICGILAGKGTHIATCCMSGRFVADYVASFYLHGDAVLPLTVLRQIALQDMFKKMPQDFFVYSGYRNQPDI